jgi:hypothetical protein
MRGDGLETTEICVTPFGLELGGGIDEPFHLGELLVLLSVEG